MDDVKKYFEVDKCMLAYIILIFVSFVLFIYSQTLNRIYGENRSKHDPLNLKLGIYPFKNVSGWQISHFVLYFILGFMFPYCMRGILTIGILWEIYESIIGCIRRSVECENSNEEDKKYSYGKSWWAGTVQDIVINTCGFLFGAILSILIYKN